MLARQYIVGLERYKAGQAVHAHQTAKIKRIMAGKKAYPPYTKPPSAKPTAVFYCLLILNRS